MSARYSSVIELPLFPLQTVLFPGGLLPLQIFEVRYLDMMGRCHLEHKPFGVVCLTQGREVRQPATPADSSAREGAAFAPEAFHKVGTLASIESLARPQPGLMRVHCVGGQRFRLRHAEQLKHGLWMGEAELLAPDLATPIPQDLMPTRVALEQLLGQMQSQAEWPEDMAFQAPHRWDDCGWVANRWCEILPLNQAFKQQLLELDSPLVRLELVADLLERMASGGDGSS